MFNLWELLLLQLSCHVILRLFLLLGWVTCVDSSSSPFLFLLFKKFILFCKTFFWGQKNIQGHNLRNKTLQEVFPVSLKCQVSSCITIWEKNRYQDYASVIWTPESIPLLTTRVNSARSLYSIFVPAGGELPRNHSFCLPPGPRSKWYSNSRAVW